MNLYLIEAEKCGTGVAAVVACNKLEQVTKLIKWEDAEYIEIKFIGKAHDYDKPTIICTEEP